ncbi:MAG: hypothetical protein BVN31_07365 [Proteobacteria bacterium ST_bin15]|nr:MAG: hypothetical protein BVN31_07365 [Proteobacteria bacterium ST_bin15]
MGLQRHFDKANHAKHPNARGSTIGETRWHENRPEVITIRLIKPATLRIVKGSADEMAQQIGNFASDKP